MSRATTAPITRYWARFYRATAGLPPRELLLRTLERIESEGKLHRTKTAIDLGCGAGTDTLELLRRGWKVLAIDQQVSALEFLSHRVPPRQRGSLSLLASPMEGLSLPKADLIYASFSLPFCTPTGFSKLWKNIRQGLVPGGHFAGQLFGVRDEWSGKRPLVFHTIRQVRSLTRRYRVELLRETEEEGQSFEGPKHWHLFDLILEKPRTA